jgi:hypothetical protein
MLDYYRSFVFFCVLLRSYSIMTARAGVNKVDGNLDSPHRARAPININKPLTIILQSTIRM